MRRRRPPTLYPPDRRAAASYVEVFSFLRLGVPWMWFMTHTFPDTVTIRFQGASFTLKTATGEER